MRYLPFFMHCLPIIIFFNGYDDEEFVLFKYCYVIISNLLNYNKIKLEYFGAMAKKQVKGKITAEKGTKISKNIKKIL